MSPCRLDWQFSGAFVWLLWQLRCATSRLSGIGLQQPSEVIHVTYVSRFNDGPNPEPLSADSNSLVAGGAEELFQTAFHRVKTQQNKIEGKE